MEQVAEPGGQRSEAEVLARLESLVPAGGVQQLLTLRQQLLDWNERVNLTAITDPVEVLSKHFLDALTLLDLVVAPQARVLDIGTGAGFPGFPLKIARPAWHLVLLEATGKKVHFQRHIVELLGLQGIETLHGRAEELAHRPAYRGSFDVVTARAVAALPTLLEYAAPFCRVGGQVLLPKKGELADELQQGQRAAHQVGLVFKADIPVNQPGLADGRRILVWQQVKRCPASFPRQSAAIARKPLGE